MKLLFVTPNLPYPPHTGSELLAYHHIRQLAQRHTIDLISFKGRRNSDLGELPEWCHHIQLIDQPPRWQVLLKLLAGVIADWPFPVSHYHSNKLARMIRQQIATHDYDVVLFQLIEMAQFRPRDYHRPTVLCMEDPLVLKYRQRSPWNPAWYAPLLTRYEAARLKRYEQKHVVRFNRTLLLNPADVQEYGRVLRNTKLAWVPYGVDANHFHFADKTLRREGMIIITGNMNHPPNIEAVEYFCGTVFPKVKQRISQANLWLVGANPVIAVSKWAADSQIHVTGFVPEMSAYLQQAMVSVCAVQLETGSQTKILEALACGTPVVASSAANHGIGAVSGQHLYVADSSAEFAERVISLLQGERWTELSRNGRQFVLDNFTWEISAAKLDAILAQVVSEGSTSSQ
jgi:polysaccharide biosynthesis protein PslH